MEKNGLSGGNSRQSAILIEPTVSRNHAGNPFYEFPPPPREMDDAFIIDAASLSITEIAPR